MKRIIKITIMILLMIVLLSSYVYAADWSDSIMTNLKTESKNDSSGSEVKTSANNIIGTILNVTRIIAVGVAIIMLLVLAMKYMMAAPGDRAEIKKSAVVYVVGATVLFASSGILTIIMNFSKNIG